MEEALDLAWADGDWLKRDRFALYRVNREAALADNPQALMKADWIARRLARAVSSPLDPESLRALMGEALDARFWNGFLTPLREAHPLTRAAAAMHAARMVGIGGGGRLSEPALLAAKLGISVGRGGAAFLPLAFGARQRLRGPGGAVSARLEAALLSMARASAAALEEIEALHRWEARARAATRTLSGRTPPVLIDLLIRHPVLSSPMLAEAATIAPATALRNLQSFEALGLTRETTGHNRFRYWTARA